MTTILFVFGTRPEAIKLAPLIKEFEKDTEITVIVCITAQHREMLDQVLDFFSIVPDYDLDIMKPNQSLYQLSAKLLVEMERVLEKANPDIVFVQGDTTTVLMAALASFYKKIKVAHIEAGLRSFDVYSPFPEEMNRLLTTRLSDFHFVPTLKAEHNLLKEGISKNKIYNVGNSVIDALYLGLSIIEKDESKYFDFFKTLDLNKKIILTTCHRRESFGQPFMNICKALLEIAVNNPEVELVYPVHLNPNIKEVAEKYLANQDNIKLLPPLDYPYLLWLMKKSYIVLTDSGGIQEEAPSLGKPVLVMRDVTERIEGIEAGTAKLVGTDKDKIIREVELLLKDRNHYDSMALAVNPYGNGDTSVQVLKAIKDLC